MEQTAKFNGVFPAIVTPFKANLEIDFNAFSELIGRLLRNQVRGIFVGGNMGEWYTQTLQERKDVANLAVESCKGRGKVILHVGSTRIEDALDLAIHGERIGVDAVASLPPYHMRFADRDIIAYYERLASVAQLPVFVYYHPVLTGFYLTRELIAKLFSIPNMAGIKFTDYDLLTLTQLIEFQDRRLHVLNGQDQVFLPSLLLGATGGIGSFYNVVPRAFVAIQQFVESGNTEAARGLQLEINQFIGMIKQYALIPALKNILSFLGCSTEKFRTSITPLSVEERNRLEKDLEASAFFREWALELRITSDE